jgi:hypothetical protein
VPTAIGLYAAYWALSIRRALVGRVYRSHALWLGVLIIFLEVNSATVNLASNNTIITLALHLILFGVIAGAFAFIDSTVPVARRSDPLLRSILRWGEARILLWADIALAGIFLVNTAVSPSFNASVVAGFLGFPLFSIPLLVGAAALLIGARRSKDPVFRGSLKWFGVFLLLFLVNTVLSIIESVVFNISSYNESYSYPALVFAPVFVLAAYALYRSARSLAPMSHLSLEAAPKVEPPST